MWSKTIEQYQLWCGWKSPWLLLYAEDDHRPDTNTSSFFPFCTVILHWWCNLQNLCDMPYFNHNPNGFRQVVNEPTHRDRELNKFEKYMSTIKVRQYKHSYQHVLLISFSMKSVKLSLQTTTYFYSMSETVEKCI